MKKKLVHCIDLYMMESVLISKYQLLIKCSDNKLKAYYKICVDSDYDEEAEKLRSEADSYGLKLNESISLSTYAELF